MSKFKVGQVWVTRDGRKARIVATDRKGGNYPIIALIEHAVSDETPDSFTADGLAFTSGGPNGLDLIREHREPREVWVSFHRSGDVDDCHVCHHPGAVKFREVIE